MKFSSNGVFISYTFFIHLALIFCNAESTAIQYHRYTPGQPTNQTQAKIKIEYTRVILKKDTILAIVPYQKFVTSKSLLCYDKCFESDGECLSLNIKDLGVNGFECQLLDTDSFLSHTSLVQQVGTQYAIIKVRFQPARLILCGTVA